MHGQYELLHIELAVLRLVIMSNNIHPDWGWPCRCQRGSTPRPGSAGRGRSGGGWCGPGQLPGSQSWPCNWPGARGQNFESRLDFKAKGNWRSRSRSAQIRSGWSRSKQENGWNFKAEYLTNKTTDNYGNYETWEGHLFWDTLRTNFPSRGRNRYMVQSLKTEIGRKQMTNPVNLHSFWKLNWTKDEANRHHCYA